ncbi:MAG: metallophosphatase family protein [Gammaproteobacteria bacterium]|nr:metallophosphatase family protein [Gammaproteobacteria bacterium]
MKKNKFIGVISDTHGLVRPEAISAMQGAELIIHAGDIGGENIIQQFSEVAPMMYVRGNTDCCSWSHQHAPEVDVIQYENFYFYAIHILREIDVDPAAAGFDVVISGHTHTPQIEYKDTVLYINPGSCGPRRFDLPVSVGHIEITPTGLKAQILELLPC